MGFIMKKGKGEIPITPSPPKSPCPTSTQLLPTGMYHPLKPNIMLFMYYAHQTTGRYTTFVRKNFNAK